MDNDTGNLFEGWKLNNPVAYLQEEIRGLEIALESANSVEEIRHIRTQIADLQKTIAYLEKKDGKGGDPDAAEKSLSMLGKIKPPDYQS